MAVLSVVFGGDPSGAVRAADQVERSFRGVAKSGASLRSVAGGFLAADLIQTAARGIIHEFGDIVGASSDLTESLSKSQQVFGEQVAGGILDWAENSNRQLGLSRQQAVETAATWGSLFENVGFDPADAAKQSESITQLSADLASFNNTAGGTKQVEQDLRSGIFGGEIEPVRKYGIDLTVARVEQEKTRLGLVDLNAESKRHNDILARESLVYAATKKAQGDYARTNTQLANSERTLSATVTNLEASLGRGLTPALALGAQALTNVLEGIIPVTDGFVDFLGYIGDVIGGADRFGKALESIPDPLKRTAAALALVVDGVADTIRAFRSGGFQAAFDELGRIQGGRILSGFETLGEEAWGVFTGAIEGAASAGIDLVVDIIASLLPGGDLATWAGDLWGWLVSELNGPNELASLSGGASQPSLDFDVAANVLVSAGMDLLVTAEGWAGDLWSWVYTQIDPSAAASGGTPTTGGARGGPSQFSGGSNAHVVPFGDIAVEAGLKAKDDIETWAGNLWGWVKKEIDVQDAINLAVGGILLGGVGVAATLLLRDDIKEWEGNLWGWVKDQLGVGDTEAGLGAVPLGGGATLPGHTITWGNVLIDVGLELGGDLADWAGNIVGWIEQHVAFGGTSAAAATNAGAIGGTVGAKDIVFHDWAVTVGSPNGITIDYGAVLGTIWDALNTPLTVSTDTAHNWDEAGNRLGESIGREFMNGVINFFSFGFAHAGEVGGPQGGPGGQGRTGIGSAITSTVAEFAKGIVTGIGTAWIDYLNSTALGKDLQDASGDPGALGKLLIDGLWDLTKKAIDLVVVEPFELGQELGHQIADKLGGKGWLIDILGTALADIFSISGVSAAELSGGAAGFPLGGDVGGAGGGGIGGSITSAITDGIVTPIVDAITGVPGQITSGVGSVDLFGGLETWVEGQITGLETWISEHTPKLPQWVTDPIGWATGLISGGGGGDDGGSEATASGPTHLPPGNETRDQGPRHIDNQQDNPIVTTLPSVGTGPTPQDVTVNVIANTDDFDSAMISMSQSLYGFTTGTWAVPVTAMTDAFDNSMISISQSLYGLIGSEWDVPIGADASGFYGAVISVSESLYGLTSDTWTVTINADTSGAIAAIADLAAHLPHSPAEKGPLSREADFTSILAEPFARAVDRAKGSLDGLGLPAGIDGNRMVVEHRWSGELTLKGNGEGKDNQEIALHVSRILAPAIKTQMGAHRTAHGW